MALTRERDPALLGALQRQAATALVEMARWKSEGHAQPAFFILARIAGHSDDAAFGLWQRCDREVVIGDRRFQVLSTGSGWLTAPRIPAWTRLIGDRRALLRLSHNSQED